LSKASKRAGKAGAANSVNFLISAIYTVAFGNAVLQVISYDNTSISISISKGIDSSIIICASICVVLSLRFLFGNNNFMEHLFESKSGTLARLYHFLVTMGESVILLASAFLVKKPYIFIKWIAVLFAIEVAWYLGCLLFAKEATTNGDGRLDMGLLANEIANFVMAAGFAVALWSAAGNQQVMAWVACGLFVANTAVDFKNNMSKYMGVT
jgi:hypothetical protein